MNDSISLNLFRDGSLVWYNTAKNDIWRKGLVSESNLINQNIWKFWITDELSTLTVTLESKFDYHLNEFDVIKKRSSKNKSDICDMTQLPFLNEPEILDCISQRYRSLSVYTNAGPILFALNPFQNLQIYNAESMKKYFIDPIVNNLILEPHIYQIARIAYYSMFVDTLSPLLRQNQTIVINGESGSGKTESTKHILHFLTSLSTNLVQGNKKDFHTLVTSTNPITESFGNAKTNRNNNSSRFGKFIQLHYSGNSSDGGGSFRSRSDVISHAKIQTYLLETIRLVHHSPLERNYHIFYELFFGLSLEKKSAFHFTHLDAFKYLYPTADIYATGTGVISSKHDASNFFKLIEALKNTGFDDSTQDSIFRIIIAVLHVGNLEFIESSNCGEEFAEFSSSQENKDRISLICQLLGVSEGALLNAITLRTVIIANNSIQKFLPPRDALYTKDVLAKTIYDMLFKFLIHQINSVLGTDNMLPVTSSNQSVLDVHTSSAVDVYSHISILDIFGFESFEQNYLEQLCINYTNEKLQDFFNYSIFESEKELYLLEGIAWKAGPYPNNTDIIDLFEEKGNGIFHVCDEQLKLPKPTDEKIVNALYNKNATKNIFMFTLQQKKKLEFTIKHFAQNVLYSGVGLVDKNRSTSAIEIHSALNSSSDKVVSQLTQVTLITDTGQQGVLLKPTPTLIPKRSHSANISSQQPSLSLHFSKQLCNLISSIRCTKAHFVRCIKPNNTSNALDCDDFSMMQQLHSSGAIAATQVFFSGFPSRIDFRDFVNRYATIVAVIGNNNYITQNTARCIIEAKSTGLSQVFQLAALKLSRVIPIIEDIFNAVDNIYSISSSGDFSKSRHNDLDYKCGLQMGRSKVFMKAKIYDYLEYMNERALNMFTRKVQRLWRMYVMHKTKKSTKRQSNSVAAIIGALLLFSDHKKNQSIMYMIKVIQIQKLCRKYINRCRKNKIYIRKVIIIQSLCRRLLHKNRYLFTQALKLRGHHTAHRSLNIWKKIYIANLSIKLIVRSISNHVCWKAYQAKRKLRLEALIAQQKILEESVSLEVVIEHEDKVEGSLFTSSSPEEKSITVTSHTPIVARAKPEIVNKISSKRSMLVHAKSLDSGMIKYEEKSDEHFDELSMPEVFHPIPVSSEGQRMKMRKQGLPKSFRIDRRYSPVLQTINSMEVSIQAETSEVAQTKTPSVFSNIVGILSLPLQAISKTRTTKKKMEKTSSGLSDISLSTGSPRSRRGENDDDIIRQRSNSNEMITHAHYETFRSIVQQMRDKITYMEMQRVMLEPLFGEAMDCIIEEEELLKSYQLDLVNAKQKVERKRNEVVSLEEYTKFTTPKMAQDHFYDKELAKLEQIQFEEEVNELTEKINACYPEIKRKLEAFTALRNSIEPFTYPSQLAEIYGDMVDLDSKLLGLKIMDFRKISTTGERVKDILFGREPLPPEILNYVDTLQMLRNQMVENGDGDTIVSHKQSSSNRHSLRAHMLHGVGESFQTSYTFENTNKNSDVDNSDQKCCVVQ